VEPPNALEGASLKTFPGALEVLSAVEAAGNNHIRKQFIPFNIEFKEIWGNSKREKMIKPEPRTYRNRLTAVGLTSFRVRVRQTDILVLAECNLETEAGSLVHAGRLQIENYIEHNPSFATNLVPWEVDSVAPALISAMISAAAAAGVGPMAAVAGALAEYVGRGLLHHSRQVIVENGGDIYIDAERSVTVAILAGDSPLSGRFGIRVPPEAMPIGVCTSSGRVGHSLSRGRAHAACVLSSSAALADAAATALGNLVSGGRDLERAAGSIAGIDGVSGGVIIAGERMAAWGDVELTAL
jgi:uncharacterized protein